MAFCQKCGQQIEDSANNCPYCGATNTSNPNAAKNNLAEKVKKLNYKNIGILVGVVVAAIVVIVLISSLFGGGHEKAIDNMIDATIFAKEKALRNCAPDEVWEYLDDEYKVDFDDIYEYVEENVAEMAMDMLEEEYGKNIKISFKITETDDIDDDDFDDIKDLLKEYGVKKKDIKKAVEVEYESTIKGKDDKDTKDDTMNLVKIGGKWYSSEAISVIVSAAQVASWDN